MKTSHIFLLSYDSNILKTSRWLILCDSYDILTLQLLLMFQWYSSVQQSIWSAEIFCPSFYCVSVFILWIFIMFHFTLLNQLGEIIHLVNRFSIFHYDDNPSFKLLKNALIHYSTFIGRWWSARLSQWMLDYNPVYVFKREQ